MSEQNILNSTVILLETAFNEDHCSLISFRHNIKLSIYSLKLLANSNFNSWLANRAFETSMLQLEGGVLTIFISMYILYMFSIYFVIWFLVFSYSVINGIFIFIFLYSQ